MSVRSRSGRTYKNALSKWKSVKESRKRYAIAKSSRTKKKEK